MKKTSLRYKSIILSDVHLGTLDCKIDEVNHFLKHTHSDYLILNGDIIDGWSLQRRGGWTKKHTRFIRLVLKKLSKKKTEIVYVRGNHDDILHRFLPLTFDQLQILDEYVYETASGRYLVVHGDGFDSITTDHRWLAVLGDIGYQWLLRVNRLYNHYRAWRGKDYYSVSKAIKARVKTAVNFVSKFEDMLSELAQKHNCTGVICGHIHTPADKEIRGLRYLNSGDWVESLTAIVEDFDGNFEVITYTDFLDRLAEKARLQELEQAEDHDDGGPVEEDDEHHDPVGSVKV
jgi:UDP-2,3-diacylglucosamine pyrophosphatase LpxH